MRLGEVTWEWIKVRKRTEDWYPKALQHLSSGQCKGMIRDGRGGAPSGVQGERGRSGALEALGRKSCLLFYDAESSRRMSTADSLLDLTTWSQCLPWQDPFFFFPNSCWVVRTKACIKLSEPHYFVNETAGYFFWPRGFVKKLRRYRGSHKQSLGISALGYAEYFKRGKTSCLCLC